jgi:cell division septal protein FtsQ
VLPRFSGRRSLDATEPLKGQLWTRSERALREPDVPRSRRVLAVATAALECVLLGWLWFGPALGVRTFDVSGARHLSTAQVLAAAGLVDGGSVLAVDGVAARQRLLNQTWVRTATVDPHLPWAVTVSISEWKPVAVYHAGDSTKLFMLSDQGVVLGSTASAGTLTEVQGPAAANPTPGDRPLDPVLLTALVNMQKGLPGLIGQEVSRFIFDSCGDLTLVSKKGWKVYFGRVLTPEEYATLRDKVGALKAIAGNGNVDYNSADLDYINVMNPSEPAAGYKAKPAPSPSPAPTPQASPPPACK